MFIVLVQNKIQRHSESGTQVELYPSGSFPLLRMAPEQRVSAAMNIAPLWGKTR
jgi:hypothetical protein